MDIDTLWRRRALGQILRAARQFYGRHWKVLLPIALAALVLIGATNALAALISNSRNPGGSGINLAWADLSKVIRPVAQALVAAIAIVVAAKRWRDREVAFLGALPGVRGRFWRVVGGAAAGDARGAVAGDDVVGLPFALRYLVGWSFVQQEVLFTDKGLRDSFQAAPAGAGTLAPPARVILVFYVIGIAAGPILSFALTSPRCR